jgi:hypothetical protein
MSSNKIFQNVIDVTWRSDLAYAIGLIASDGHLSKDLHRIGMHSKDLEMINLFKKALQVKNKIGRNARGGEKEKKYFYTSFKSKQFYSFLQNIGITPVKSKTIQSVEIPNEFFADFVRGFFDGDGTFWTHWDKRWPNSYVYHVAFYSASKPFIEWLQNKMQILYQVKGLIKKGAGVYEIRYAKGDSRKIFQKMYYKDDLLFLSRKYSKMKGVLDFDAHLKHSIRTPR